MRHLALLCFLLLVACGDSGPTDAGGQDGGPSDGASADLGAGDTGGLDAGADAGAPNDAGGGDEWAWCPSASDYVGNAQWPYAVRVEGSALFCAYNQGATEEEALQNKMQIRIVPGTYPLPDTEGDFTLRLPMCARDVAASGSSLDADGTLNVNFRDFIGDTMKTYTINQTMTIDGATWTLRITAELFHPTSVGGPMPDFVINEQRRQGAAPDLTVSYELCPGMSCAQDRWFLEPCASEQGPVTEAITFDRGDLSVHVTVFEGFGPSSPAALVQATGQIDGNGFTQREYFQLSHRVDHHNSGGGFLAMFDTPIGNVCGIKAQIPSRDGGWATLGAWTIDCGLQTIEALSGVVRQ